MIKESCFGYIYERVVGHPFADKDGWVFQHRIVAEKFLLNKQNSVEINGKRYLKQEYEVHHINFDRRDNRVDNLQVLTKQQHRKIHYDLNPNERNSLGQFIKRKDDNMIKVKRTSKTAVIPERKSNGAAGYDLYADISEPVIIEPHTLKLIDSGIAFSIPKEYCGILFARSGLSIKEQLRLATGCSVIDSDYRGSVIVPIFNDGDVLRIINPQDRIAQIVFEKVLITDLELVDSLDDTERGENGFGSSGR